MPELGIKPITISRWLSDCIRLAGVEVGERMIGHSVRSKAVTTARVKGMSTKEIIDAVEWKSDSTFFRYYYRPSALQRFGQSVLV